MTDIINMTAVFSSLDSRKAEAQATIAKYSAADQAEASRIASVYDNCAKDSVKHLCDTAALLRERFTPQAPRIITTADGYMYTQQPSGWYTDGDVEFDINNTDIFGLVWQVVDGIYCADGDGLVSVVEADGFFFVNDQGDTVVIKRNLREALFAAQSTLAANYPAVYESNIE